MENDPKTENEEPEESLDLSGLEIGGLDLSPDWARATAGVASTVQPKRHRSGDRPFRKESGRRPERDRKPRPGMGADRGRGHPRRGEADRRPAERPVLLKGIRVSFVPDRQALNTVIKLMKHNRVAYSIQELADLFMSKTGASMARFEVTAEKEIELYQLQADRSIYLSREGAGQAALARHLEQDFEREELAGEAPKGEFKCVGRCRKSGTLLGPPNYHGYGQAVTSLWAERFSDLPLEEYKKTIELVHDQEVVDAWKDQASKSFVYRPRKKGGGEAGEEQAEDVPSLSASEVEQQFLETLLAKAVKKTAKASVPHASLVHCEQSLQLLAQVVRTREMRRPSSIQFALRPALKNSGIHLFKIGGIPFAGAVAPKSVEDKALAPELVRWITFIRENSNAKRNDVVAACGGEGEDPASGLRLLIEQGHVLLLSDQTLRCA
jgi:hypothetical protein